MPRERPYRCTVCGWQGTELPQDVGDAAPCPTCGSYMYPQSFGNSWGAVLFMIAATVGVICAVAFYL